MCVLCVCVYAPATYTKNNAIKIKRITIIKNIQKKIGENNYAGIK